MTIMQDYSAPLKAMLLANSNETKLQAAIAWMDRRWVLHEANRVPKLTEPLPDHGLTRFKPRVLRGKKTT